MGPSAVVFGYHDVGVRCLAVMLAHGVRIPLVVTHRDDPRENVWFGSVERLAREHDIEVMTPDDPADPEFGARLQRIAPDFIFSFYYRHMLPHSVLGTARRGAFNVHGSLLPKYRGRVPVNWAIIHGERETGATLHEMVAKPDAGRIVDQLAVPILPDDTAIEVFRKVTVAAEIVLHRSLAPVLAGTAPMVPQDLARGSYFGGRKPADGLIDWTRGARDIHNLVRAVAPPYPGAFTSLAGHRLSVTRTRVLAEGGEPTSPYLRIDASQGIVAQCADGGLLLIADGDLDGEPLHPETFIRRFGPGPIALQDRP